MSVGEAFIMGGLAMVAFFVIGLLAHIGLRLTLVVLGVLCLVVGCNRAWSDVSPDVTSYATEYAAAMEIPVEKLVIQVVRFENINQLGASAVGRIDGEVASLYVQVSDRDVHVPVRPNTVRHELCHIETFVKLGRTRERGRYHGPTWKRCAERHNVDYSNSVLD